MAFISNNNILNNYNTKCVSKSTSIQDTSQDIPQLSNNSFQHILQSNSQNLENNYTSKPVVFSKHATTRLNDRNINLSNSQLERVESGIKTAQQKGIKDSLVLVDDVALLVNIKNKVVVTAMGNNNNSNSEQVYTNIDGAVIV